MSDEMWTCCECNTTAQGYTRDDGLPPGWAENVDDDVFCAACLKRRPLDPPEDDVDSLQAALAETAEAG